MTVQDLRWSLERLPGEMPVQVISVEAGDKYVSADPVLAVTAAGLFIVSSSIADQRRLARLAGDPPI